MKLIAPLTALVSIAFSMTPSLQARDATLPQPRDIEYEWMSIANWYRAHAEDVEVAAKGEAQLVFLGDSITQSYQWAPAWEREIAKYQPANFGIGGDKTQNLIWRLKNGAVGKLDPRMVVMMIGVNNFGHDNASPQEIFAGVEACLEQARTCFPRAKVLLLGVFPYDEKADSPNRERVKQLNRFIATLADEDVRFLDIGKVFLEEDGSISKDIMGDFLHPTAEGYERMTKAILPFLSMTLGK